MNASALRDQPTPLEKALLDVHATLADLIVAAEEQYAAVVAHDRAGLESVTRQQERLSARLARVEARRLEVLAGRPLGEAVRSLPAPEAAHAEAVRRAIAESVRELKQRQTRTANLLEQSIDLTSQTLTFLQRLLTGQPAVYGARGVAPARHSLLVDSRA
jgi:flagellar biosynthesis/type III secretory pathway chaperone